ncbi:hypothetical protein [Lentzea cavernae]|uniref:Uncharacterized protein n=1 Tax=Lentzea cavernae TaxID=2020703 RepID=A0ABQ3MRJ3_9PSEU|nr:hypothetical protein [Lentzea cavernae]GHH56581.1 hypothetical protein GCM10017774_74890 [Lentzea cavernae]
MSARLVALLEELIEQRRSENHHEEAEHLTDLLMALASADELYAALFRDDENAMVFHAEVLNRQLDKARALESRTSFPRP